MKFTFQADAGITLSTEVEADSLAAAVAEVRSRRVQRLCHQCSSGHPDVEWTTSGELDCGDPSVWELVCVLVDGIEVHAAAFAEAKRLWSGDVLPEAGKPPDESALDLFLQFRTDNRTPLGVVEFDDEELDELEAAIRRLAKAAQLGAPASGTKPWTR